MSQPSLTSSPLRQPKRTWQNFNFFSPLALPEDDAKERSVNVLLDGEESELSFLEQHDADVTVS